MLSGWKVSRGTMVTMALIGLGASMMPSAAFAQSDERIGRVEAEIRALQRAVFPGGGERFFEPEVSTSGGNSSLSGTSSGTPSGSVLTEILGRLDAIEAQLARLTASSEVNTRGIQQGDLRLDALEAGGISTATTNEVVEVAETNTQPTGIIPVPGENIATAQNTPSVETGPTEERLTGVRAITKPVSDDEADDEYVYGFRLWDAGYYPEAQQQLALFVEKHPSHWRTTYGRNLLGRAFLDAGEPRRAATHFFENYQSDKQAARSPDSLLYLAEAMVGLGDANRACIALAEFGDTYPALATGRLQTQYDRNRNGVDCS